MPTLATALTINMRGADIPTVTAKQHDANSRVLEVRLLDGENPLPLEAVSAALFVKKPDGTNVCSPGTVPDGEGNVLRFPLSAQTLAAAGIARCEIALYGGDGSLLSTIPFRMAVVASVRDEDAVVSSDEYSLLTETVLESRELVRRMEELLEAGPGDPSGPGLQIAAHNENADAHRDIRQSVADVAAGSYTKGEIDGLLEGLSPSEPGPAVDAYTKEETRRLVADHDSDSGAHDILRRELAEQIDAHTGDSAAHRDIRDTVAALEHSVYTRGDVDALAAGITAAFAETLGGYRTAEASDEALTRHSEDANTHRDIRDA